MYLSHFGFDQLPFSLTPNTSLFYDRGHYGKALDATLMALKMGEGFIKITGEVGTGKTILCRKLMLSLGEDFVTAYIPNPLLTPQQLFMTLADEISIKLPPNPTPHTLVKSITQRLLHFRRANKSMVLIIDEAQAMPKKTLEILRLLTNIETERTKLLQIVLFAQPELDTRLQDPGIRQLAQRITFSNTLEPMKGNYATISDYITHRLIRAGYRGDALFHPAAIKRIVKYSQGTPRIINILCHKALLLAFSEGAKQVKSKHVNLGAKDSKTILDTLRPKRRSLWKTRTVEA